MHRLNEETRNQTNKRKTKPNKHIEQKPCTHNHAMTQRHPHEQSHTQPQQTNTPASKQHTCSPVIACLLVYVHCLFDGLCSWHAGVAHWLHVLLISLSFSMFCVFLCLACSVVLCLKFAVCLLVCLLCSLQVYL